MPLLACTAVIMWRLKAPYRGFFGFFRALAASGLSLLIGAAIPALVLFRIAHISETPEGMVDGMLGLSVTILVIALVGGLVASVVLSRLAPAFPGRGGWLRGLLTTGAAIVATWLTFAAVGFWLYGIGAFDDVAMYW